MKKKIAAFASIRERKSFSLNDSGNPKKKKKKKKIKTLKECAEVDDCIRFLPRVVGGRRNAELETNNNKVNPVIVIKNQSTTTTASTMTGSTLARAGERTSVG